MNDNLDERIISRLRDAGIQRCKSQILCPFMARVAELDPLVMPVKWAHDPPTAPPRVPSAPMRLLYWEVCNEIRKLESVNLIMDRWVSVGFGLFGVVLESARRDGSRVGVCVDMLLQFIHLVVPCKLRRSVNGMMEMGLMEVQQTCNCLPPAELRPLLVCAQGAELVCDLLKQRIGREEVCVIDVPNPRPILSVFSRSGSRCSFWRWATAGR